MFLTEKGEYNWKQRTQKGSGGDEVVLKTIAKPILIKTKPFRLIKLFLSIRGSKFRILFKQLKKYFQT